MSEERLKKHYSIQTVQRAAQIIRAFSRDKNRLSLTELNQITGIGKSSLQRLLFTLTNEGLLQRSEDDKRYQLGLDFIFYAELVERNTSLLTIAQPVMEKINRELTESVSLSVIEKKQRKCIHQLESKHELTTLTYVGQTSPLYAGASAKVLLAHFSKDNLQTYMNCVKLEALTDNTMISKEALLDDLETIRKNGYAITKGERVKGALSISAPVFDPFSRIFASLSTIIPYAREDEYNLEKVIFKLVDGASEITRKLQL